MYYLYILRSLKDNKLYVGVTVDINQRLNKHNKGQVKSTKHRRPFILVYKQIFETRSEARKKEWQFKCTPWGGKLKKKLANRSGIV